MWEHKVQNLITVIGLAFGLYCFSLTTYSTRIINSTNKCFDNYSRIASLVCDTKPKDTIPSTRMTYLKGGVVDKVKGLHLHDIQAVCRVLYPCNNSYIFMGDSEKEKTVNMNSTEISGDFMQIFTPRVIQGSWNNAATMPNSVVLTRSMARKIFKQEGRALGRKLRHRSDAWGVMSGPRSCNYTSHDGSSKVIYTVRAIIEDIPIGTTLSFFNPIEMLLLNDESSAAFEKRYYMTNDDGAGFVLHYDGVKEGEINQIYLLLAPGTHREKLSKQLYGKSGVWDEKNRGYYLQSPEPEEILYVTLRDKFSPVAGGIGMLVLLICLINYFTLLTGSWINRMKEFSLRKLLGANGTSIFVMLTLHTLVILVAAGLLTLLLRELYMPRTIAIAGNIGFELTDGSFILYLVEYIGGIALLSIAICAFLSTYIMHSLSQTQLAGRGKGALWRNLALGAQFLICWIFVIFSMSLQIESQNKKSEIYSSLTDEEKGLIFQINWGQLGADKNTRESLTQQITHMSGVKEVAGSGPLEINNYNLTNLEVDGKKINCSSISADKNFARFMNLHFVKGCNYKAEGEFLVNEIFARNHHLKVGQQFKAWKGMNTITGIVEGTLNNPINPTDTLWNQMCIYQTEDNPSALSKKARKGFLLSSGHSTLALSIKARKGCEKSVRKMVENLLNNELPQVSADKGGIHIESLEEEIERSLNFELRYRNIILFVTLASLFITLIGVYAAISIDTERRRKEMAIRKINGARPAQIALLFVRRYLWLLLGSFILSIPMLFYIAKLWGKSLNNGILFWIAIPAAITLLTLATLAIKVWNIVRENPAEVVKGQ